MPRRVWSAEEKKGISGEMIHLARECRRENGRRRECRTAWHTLRATGNSRSTAIRHSRNHYRTMLSEAMFRESRHGEPCRPIPAGRNRCHGMQDMTRFPAGRGNGYSKNNAARPAFVAERSFCSPRKPLMENHHRQCANFPFSAARAANVLPRGGFRLMKR